MLAWRGKKQKREHATSEDGASHSRVLIGEDERIFWQVPNAMADGRELFSRESFDAPGSEGENAETMLAYGWMNARAWKHAHGRLRFELVRTQLTLGREPGDGPRESPPEVETLDRFDEQTRWLYDRCADGWGAALIRDEQYLNRRFVDGGRREYLRLGVRDDEGLLRGYAILASGEHRSVGADHASFSTGGSPTYGPSRNAVFLADWLVPFDEPEVAELLHEAVLAQARTRTSEALYVVVPEWSRWFCQFQDWGWIAEPSDRLIAVRSTVPKYDMHWLRDHWWYQWAESHLI